MSNHAKGMTSCRPPEKSNESQTDLTNRIACAIRHIQTAVDVDPWAVEIAVDAMERMASANLQPNLQPTRNLASNDCISREAAIDAVETKIKKWNAVDGEGYHVGLGLRYTDVIDTLTELPSAQPEPLSDAYMKAVWTWLLDYQIKAAELKGKYTPYEVLSWVANDWRKEHE